METIIYFIFAIVMLAAAYVTGTMIEKAHYKSIEQKENYFLPLPAVTSKEIGLDENILSAELVMGSVVISLDNFKRFLAGMRNIVGGRIKSYESLIDRGRREAVLRMKENALAKGADAILNMRFQTSTIGSVTQGKKGGTGCFEVLAYGTAVTYKK